MAERVGFEPTVSCPTPVFKTGAINRSTTSPCGGRCQIRRIDQAKKSSRSKKIRSRLPSLPFDSKSPPVYAISKRGQRFYNEITLIDTVSIFFDARFLHFFVIHISVTT